MFKVVYGIDGLCNYIVIIVGVGFIVVLEYRLLFNFRLDFGMCFSFMLYVVKFVYYRIFWVYVDIVYYVYKLDYVELIL